MPKLTEAERDRFRAVEKVVLRWARLHAAEDLHYGSPYSYWSSALHAQVIQPDELELARKSYGDMFHYRGD